MSGSIKETTNNNGDWFVRMSNGTIFGPINTSGLSHWASDGRVMPDDEVSVDRTNWLRACDLEELGMDTMIQLPDGSFKGPYNPKSLEILAKEGKIPPKAVRFHKSELEERMANRQMSLFGEDAFDKSDDVGGAYVSETASEQFEQQLEQVRREAQDALELAQREAEDLRAEREQLLDEKDALTQQLSEVQTKLDEALVAVATPSTIEAPPEVTEEFEQLKKDYDDLEASLQQALSEKADLLDQLSQANAMLESTSATLSVDSSEELNAAKEECDELRKQAALLAEQLSATEKEREELAQRIEEFSSASAQEQAPLSVIDSEEYLLLLSEKEAKEGALQIALQDLEQINASLNSATKAHEEDTLEIQGLRTKLDSIQQQMADMSSELAVAKENSDLSKELLTLAEAAKKELTEALSVELANVEEKATQLAVAEEKSEVAEQKASALEKELNSLKESNETTTNELQQLKEEYSELLEFSNSRDTEHSEEISALKQQLEERPEVVQTRREQMLEEQLKHALQEVDAIRSQMENLSAQKMTEDNYTEDDISLIKRFADESINVLRKTLEEEKEANLNARAKSIERQRLLHEELQRLERVMQRDPGELTRAEMSEQRANKQIAKLQQELESERRHHQADVARAEANITSLEQRYRLQMQKEVALREQLSSAESKATDFDSVNNLLRRREAALLAAEKEFEEARQQWKMTEETLKLRIDELENGAGLLFDNRDVGSDANQTKPVVARSGLSRMVLHK